MKIVRDKVIICCRFYSIVIHRVSGQRFTWYIWSLRTKVTFSRGSWLLSTLLLREHDGVQKWTSWEIFVEAGEVIEAQLPGPRANHRHQQAGRCYHCNIRVLGVVVICKHRGWKRSLKQHLRAPRANHRHQEACLCCSCREVRVLGQGNMYAQEGEKERQHHMGSRANHLHQEAG